MRDKSKEFFPLVEKFYSSGLRANAFCEQQGIKRCLLDYWKRRYRDQNKSTQVEKKGFASVSVLESKSEGGITIEYSDGTRLIFEVAGDAAMIKQFIPALTR